LHKRMLQPRIGSRALAVVWLVGGVILLLSIILLLRGFEKLPFGRVQLILAGVAVMVAATIVPIMVLVLKGGQRRFEA